jgi:hypothetical protein
MAQRSVRQSISPSPQRIRVLPVARPSVALTCQSRCAQTAQGVITLGEPGTAGGTVTLTMTRADGGSIDHVGGGQPNQNEALMAVKEHGPANVQGKGSKC